MADKTYNWETTFDTRLRLMYHKFNDRFQVVSDLSSGLIRCFRDDQLVSKIDGSRMSVKEYTQFLLRTEREVNLLAEINLN